MKTALLIFLISLQAHAADGLRCERLFFPTEKTQVEIEQGLEKLARFWVAIVAEPNRDKKKLSREEFEILINDFRLTTGQSEKQARAQFQQKLEVLRASIKENEMAERQKTFALKTQSQNESDAIHRWKSYLKLKPFGDKPVTSALPTPDGSKLIVESSVEANRYDTKVYNLETLEEYEIKIPQTTQAHRRSLSADGSTWFLNLDDHDYRLFDMRTVTELPKPKLPVQEGWLLSNVELNADGSKLLFFTVPEATKDQVLGQVYDLKSNKLISDPISFPVNSHSTKISPDGKKLFYSTSSGLHGFNLETRSEIPIPLAQADQLRKPIVEFSQDGHTMVITLQDGSNSVFLFDLESFVLKEVQVPNKVGFARGILNSPFMLLTGKSSVAIFDPITGAVSPFFKTEEKSFPLSDLTPDFKSFFLSSNENNKMLDVDFNGKDLTQTTFHDSELSPAKMGHLAFIKSSTDGLRFIGRTFSGELIVWFRNVEDAKKFQGYQVQERMPE